MNRPHWSGYLLVLLAASLWSTGGFYAKAPIFEEWSLESRGMVLAFWRALFAACVLALFIRRIQWRWPMATMAACFCVMNWLYLNAVVKVEASIAIWLQSTAPAWVVLAAWIGKETVTRRDVWLLGWSALGVAIILVPQFGNAPLDGLLFGLLAGVAYSGVVLSLRHLRDCDSAWLVFLNHLTAAIVLLPFVVGFGVAPTPTQFGYLICFGVLQMGLPYLLFARGLRQVPSHEAALIGLLEPILLPVWVYLAWHGHSQYEPPAWTTIFGGCLILAGLGQRYFRRVPQTRLPPTTTAHGGER